MAEHARCAAGRTLTDLMPAASDLPHGRTVEQMFADEPGATRTADGDPADETDQIERIRRAAADLARSDRMIDEWGWQSFPASDPPPTW
jgi:hypothetical protein